jgi:hypothetical protein
MRRTLVMTKWGSEKTIPLEDKELDKAIKENFDFEIGYLPEHFGCFFLMTKKAPDSDDDCWDVCIKYTKVDGKFIFEEVKRNINFSEVIEVAISIIKEKYEDLKKIYG